MIVRLDRKRSRIEQSNAKQVAEGQQTNKEREKERRGSKTSWNIFLLLTLVFCMSFMVACDQVPQNTEGSVPPLTNNHASRSTEQSTSDPNPSYLTSLTYSNLVDESSQLEVRHAMLSAGLSQGAVDEFS